MDHIEIVAAVIVGVMSTARLTRLVTQDSYPPAAWLRAKWAQITHDGPWSELATCPYCAAPYITALVLGWGLLTDFQPAWWIVNGILGGAYAASMVVVRDGE